MIYVHPAGNLEVGVKYKVLVYELGQKDSKDIVAVFNGYTPAEDGHDRLKFKVGHGLRALRYVIRSDDLLSVKQIHPRVGNTPNDINVGNSDYSKRTIQPWDIWEEYDLNPWDADIVKRILRTKKDASMTADDQRILDYEKIKHICDKRISMLDKR